MKIAVIGEWSAVPWIPIMSALWSGLSAHGHSVLVLPMGVQTVELGRELALQYEPDLVLFPIHHSERPHLPLWLDLFDGKAKRVALCFDDPYDMATVLAFGSRFDHLLSPEPLAVECYRRRGWKADELAPVIDGRMHFRSHDVARPRIYDVLSVGGRQWAPRTQYMPQLVAMLAQHGKTFGEISGNRRWVAGRELTRQLHMSRVTFDLPRLEFFKTTNTELLPCTYPGPRIHIAAATGTPILAISPRPDTAAQFPYVPRCTIEDSFGELLKLLALSDCDREGMAEANFATWQERHTPEIRASQLLALVR